MASYSKTFVLAIVFGLVVSTVSSVAFVAPVAADASGVTTTSRTVSSQTVTPGETVTVTTSVTYGENQSRTSLAERFPAELEGPSSLFDIEVDVVSGNANVISKIPADDGLDVVFENVEANTTVNVTYELSVPESASHGDSYVVDGNVSTTNGTTQVDSVSFDVTTVKTSTSLGTSSVVPGGSAEVTLTVDVGTDVSRMNINQRFDGNVSASSLESVNASTNVTQGPVISTESGIDATFENVSAGTTLTLTYTISVPESAANNSAVSIRGNVTFGNDSAAFSDSELAVVEDVTTAIAGSDGKVDTGELRAGINAWVNSEPVVGDKTVSTRDLRELIRRWVQSG